MVKHQVKVHLRLRKSYTFVRPTQHALKNLLDFLLLLLLFCFAFLKKNHSNLESTDNSS